MTTKVEPTVEKWGGDQEANKCEFCGVVKPVQRYYLRIKNKHFDDNKKGCYSKFFYYCNDCGIDDSSQKQELLKRVEDKLGKLEQYYLWDMPHLLKKDVLSAIQEMKGEE